MKKEKALTVDVLSSGSLYKMALSLFREGRREEAKEYFKHSANKGNMKAKANYESLCQYGDLIYKE